MATTLSITSASYDSVHQTLQVVVTNNGFAAGEVYLYDGIADITDSGNTILASGSIGDGTAKATTATLTISNVALADLQTYASKLFVNGTTGNPLASGGVTYFSSKIGTPYTFTAPAVSGITQSIGLSGVGTQSMSDTITVTASAAAGVASVEIYDGTNPVGAATQQKDGSWTYTATSLAEGTHSFDAIVTDNLGKASALAASLPSAKAVTDVVDLTAPVIGAISQTGGSKDGTQSTSDTITVANADITESGSGVKSVEIYDGAKDLGKATLSNGKWTLTATGLANGAHTFAAVATDNAGNASKLASSPTVTDLVQPTGVNSIAQSSGASNSWTSSTSDTIILTASSTNSSVKSVEIYDTVSGATTATDLGAATLSNGIWTYAATGLADGTHTFSAVVTDSAGNASKLASSLSVIDNVDLTAPVVSAVTQSVATAWDSTGSDTIAVTASDGNGSGVKTVEIYDGAKDLGTAKWSIPNQDYELSATGLTQGAHTFAAVVTDSVGNASTLASSPTVTDLVQPVGVAANGITQSVATAWTTATSDTITVTASDPGNVGVKSVEIYDGTTDLGAATLSNGKYSLTVNDLTKGAHTFAAVVTDNKGDAASTLASSPTVTDNVELVGVNSITQSVATASTNSTSDTITVSASSSTGSSLTSVEIYDGTKDLGAATLKNGSWTYTAAGLAEGAHTFAAVATDKLGNVSVLASSKTVTDNVDLTAPVISAVTQSVTTAWDLSATDDTITVTASDVNGSGVKSVEIFEGTKDVGAASQVGSNSWTINPTLADGTHTFTAVATDKAGNVSSSSLSVTDQVDATAPTVSDSQSALPPAKWNTVASDTITVTALDATSGVKSVEISDKYNNVTTDLGAATLSGGVWKYMAAGLADGQHAFTATVTDNAGNVATKSDLTANIDATGPVVTMAQTGSSTGTTVTSDTITLSASDIASGVASLTLTENGATVTPISSGGNSVLSLTGLADGVYTFTATATDNAGNVTTQTIKDVVDTTAPVVSSLAGSASGASETITGKVTDATSGVASVAIYDNNVWVGSTAVDASGNFTFVKGGLTDGVHTFAAVATDNAGNASTLASSPTVTAQPGQTPPVVSAIAQSGSGAWTDSTSDTITVTATSTNTVKSVEVYDGTKDLGAATKQNDGSWTYTANGLADGVHTFAAVATDNLGTASTLASSPTVIDQVDATVPVPTVTQTADPVLWNKVASDTITISASDATSGVKSVSLLQDGVSVQLQQSGGNYVYTASNLSDGEHVFRATVVDNAGNTSARTITAGFDVNAPTISGITQSASGDWTSTRADTITVTASDGTGSGVRSVHIYDTVGNSTVDLGAASYQGNGSWVFTAGGLTDGQNVLSAVATDRAGNTSTVGAPPTVTDNVDTRGAPDLTKITATPGANGQESFSFGVVDLIKGAETPNGPAIDHFSYWFDQNATANSVSNSALTAQGLQIGNSGIATETITADTSNLGGQYFHVQAVDVLGHTSGIFNKQV